MTSGIFNSTYQQDSELRRLPAQRIRGALIIVGAVAFPFVMQSNIFALLLANQVMIAAIGAIGLNILVGFTGQISLGQGGFMAVGAYTAGVLSANLGIPWYFAVPIGALATALMGLIFGIPSLRLKGLYLAIATLAAQEIIEWFIRKFDFKLMSFGGAGGSLNLPKPTLFGIDLNSNFAFYWVILICLALTVLAAANLFRTRHGRALIAIRDQDIAASVMGVNPFATKLLAFALSSFFVGLAGALSVNYNARTVTWENYTIEVSITYLAMIIIGGLGSISGSIYGAIFMTLLPDVIRALTGPLAGSVPQIREWEPYIRQSVFGVVIVLFLVLEPKGIAKIWQNIKDYFRLWPFSY